MVTRMLFLMTHWFEGMEGAPVRVPRDWRWPQGWVIPFELEFSSFAVSIWLSCQSQVSRVRRAECPGRFWLRMRLAMLFGAVFLTTPLCARQPVYKLISGCVPCHGADGIAKFGEVPNLAGQNEIYLLNQLRAFHKGRRVHKEMRYMSHNLTEEEMEAIAAYFSSLPPR
jgi:cytochrome c553